MTIFSLGKFGNIEYFDTANEITRKKQVALLKIKLI